MPVKGYCGKACAECEGCHIDSIIPCLPDCKNLTEDGQIKIKDCLSEGCSEVKYIFDMVQATDAEILDKYGEVAEYPYEYN